MNVLKLMIGFVCSMTMALLADTSAVGAVNRPLRSLGYKQFIHPE